MLSLPFVQAHGLPQRKIARLGRGPWPRACGNSNPGRSAPAAVKGPTPPSPPPPPFTDLMLGVILIDYLTRHTVPKRSSMNCRGFYYAMSPGLALGFGDKRVSGLGLQSRRRIQIRPSLPLVLDGAPLAACIFPGFSSGFRQPLPSASSRIRGPYRRWVAHAEMAVAAS